MRLDSARLFRLALAVSLAVSALSFFAFTWRWPLVGDASLIHYIAFLISRGWAPYHQLGDMNMPGSYLIELAAMHVFGMGALAWRLFDFTLLLVASACFALICRNPAPSATNPGAPSMTVSLSWVGSKCNWLAALFASSLFILIHGRDGLSEGGQRDLTMAVCLLAATAFLSLAVRRGAQDDAPTTLNHSASRAILYAALFGLFSGLAATIKPTAILLTLVQLLLALHALRPDQAQPGHAQNTQWTRLAVSALVAYFIAPLLALLFLLRKHAFSAFLAGFRGIVPYYASLGHRPLGFVLLHSLSPLLALVILWLLVLLLEALAPRPPRIVWSLRKPPQSWERTALLLGVLFGLLNCVAQQRALPYYRYPLLVFLLPLIALDLTAILNLSTHSQPATAPPRRPVSKKLAQTLAALALAYGALFLAPQSAVLIHRYRWWQTDFISSLQSNLNALGGPSLSGHIQCIDSISGCNNVLYRMRLEPATGVLSDFLLFGSPTDRQPTATIPVIRDTRAAFLTSVAAHPPQVIVVTSHLHIDGPDDFEKLARWPAFEDRLGRHYTLATQWSPARTARWWSREETPASYRIYLLRETSLRDLPHPATATLPKDPARPHP